MKTSNQILNVAAHLKYVEYLQYVFDNCDDSMTLGEIRNDFKKKFETLPQPLLNQYFGFYRLIPLLFIKEEYKKSRKKLEGEVELIKHIRDSVAHNSISADEDGFNFHHGKRTISLTYTEFERFIHSVENNFMKDEFK